MQQINILYWHAWIVVTDISPVDIVCFQNSLVMSAGAVLGGGGSAAPIQKSAT